MDLHLCELTTVTFFSCFATSEYKVGDVAHVSVPPNPSELQKAWTTTLMSKGMMRRKRKRLSLLRKPLLFPVIQMVSFHFQQIWLNFPTFKPLLCLFIFSVSEREYQCHHQGGCSGKCTLLEKKIGIKRFSKVHLLQLKVRFCDVKRWDKVNN